MAKKTKAGEVNKSAEIRELLTQNPEITANEAIAALAKKGIQIHSTLVLFQQRQIERQEGPSQKGPPDGREGYCDDERQRRCTRQDRRCGRHDSQGQAPGERGRRLEEIEDVLVDAAWGSDWRRNGWLARLNRVSAPTPSSGNRTFVYRSWTPTL